MAGLLLLTFSHHMVQIDQLEHLPMSILCRIDYSRSFNDSPKQVPQYIFTAKIRTTGLEALRTGTLMPFLRSPLATVAFTQPFNSSHKPQSFRVLHLSSNQALDQKHNTGDTPQVRPTRTHHNGSASHGRTLDRDNGASP